MGKRLRLLAFAAVLALAAPGLPAAAAEEAPRFSADAVKEFAEIWNGFFEQNDPLYQGGYTLSADNNTLKSIRVTYNRDHQEVGYRSEHIPADANLYLFCYPASDEFGFCVFSDHMKEDLEKIVISAGETVVEPDVHVSHTPQDMWRVMLTMGQMMELYLSERFTISLTVGGQEETIDISKEQDKFLFDLATWILEARRYVDTALSQYRSAELLPPGSSSPGETPPVTEISVAELCANTELYTGRYVIFTGLEIADWAIDDGSGVAARTDAAREGAKVNEGYDLLLLARHGEDYLAMILVDYKEWGWNESTGHLVDRLDTLAAIDVAGRAYPSDLTWGDRTGMPVIVAEQVRFD